MLHKFRGDLIKSPIFPHIVAETDITPPDDLPVYLHTLFTHRQTFIEAVFHGNLALVSLRIVEGAHLYELYDVYHLCGVSPVTLIPRVKSWKQLSLSRMLVDYTWPYTTEHHFHVDLNACSIPALLVLVRFGVNIKIWHIHNCLFIPESEQRLSILFTLSHPIHLYQYIRETHWAVPRWCSFRRSRRVRYKEYE